MEKSTKCAVCYKSFRPSICVDCVNRGYNQVLIQSDMILESFKFLRVRIWWHFVCRLNEYKVKLDSLKSLREVSYFRLSGLLVTKVHCWVLSLIWDSFAFLVLNDVLFLLVIFTIDQEKAISQRCWKELQNEKLAKLREKLQLQVEKLQQSLNIRP
jgi:hypothetical protein